jgi:hypothetical protein
MATTFLDLIVVLLCPRVLSAAAWIIFIKELAGTDEISEVVKSLTRTNGVEEDTKRGTGVSQKIKGERPSDERNTFTR